MQAVHIISALVILGFTGVNAQDVATGDTTIVYPATYFAEYLPVTAQDMLDRIPGLDTTGAIGGSRTGGDGGGNNQRGLGDGGGNTQILINGKRIAGKSNQADAQLRRISAGLVDYIEIIRGTSGNLDIRGSGQVINVVLFGNYSESSLSYALNLDHHWNNENLPGGMLSYSGQTGNLNYLLSAQADPNYEYRVYRENSRLSDYSANDAVLEKRTREQTRHEYVVNLQYEIDARSSARLNGLYGTDDFTNEIDRWTTDLRASAATVRQEFDDTDANKNNWEFGGDYEFNFAGGGRFKILFIANRRDDAQLLERFTIKSSDPDNKILYLFNSSRNEERIQRGSYTTDLVPGQNVEMGFERALTTLDSGLHLATDRAGPRSPAYGGLVPAAVANSNSTVEEIRYEPFMVHNWHINDRMTLESTLKYEVSEIEQSGDVYNKRDFNFAKPKLDYRFDLTPTLQLRAILEKTVSQLSFSDFVAASDNNDRDREVQAGNVQLQQEEAWEYDLNLEYRLPDDIGVVSGSIYYHDLQNVIDRIDVSPAPNDLQSANGNIGDGVRYGLRANASIRLRFIDLPNILTTARVALQDSEVTDPFLNIERRMRFSDRGRLELGFRHDLSALQLNYGLQWSKTFDGGRIDYDLEDIEIYHNDPATTAFVEYVTPGGTTLRLEGSDLLDNKRCRERRRFIGPIASRMPEEVEYGCSSSGPVVALKVNGKF